MDEAVTRLYEQHSPAQLDTLSEAYVLKFLSESEKQVLATRYLTFEVNVPVTVSLMRDQGQKIAPVLAPGKWFHQDGHAGEKRRVHLRSMAEKT